MKLLCQRREVGSWDRGTAVKVMGRSCSGTVPVQGTVVTETRPPRARARGTRMR